ncbi:hypothetical protein JCM17823_21170 [Halorubrum gandharaense]
MTRSRRDLLRAAGGLAGAGGLVGAAGCLDFAAGDGPQGPDGTPTELSCADESFVRLDAPFDGHVAERTTETPETTLELSTEGTSETYGSDLRLVLRNTGDAAAETRGDEAYALQRETDAGWQDVRGSPDGEASELGDDPAPFEPNSTHSWDLTLTEDGLADDIDAVDSVGLTVCPDLGPGTHRFVYWGIEDADPVGIEFELVG